MVVMNSIHCADLWLRNSSDTLNKTKARKKKSFKTETHRNGSMRCLQVTHDGIFGNLRMKAAYAIFDLN